MRLVVEFDVDAPACLTEPTVLTCTGPVLQLRRIEVTADTVETVGGLGVDLASVTSDHVPHLPRSGHAPDERTLSLGRTLGDDVDDAVHRVGSPERAGGPSDDLDAIKIRQRHVLGLPEHAAEQLRVDAPAVDHDEQLVVGDRRKSARGDRPAAAIEARHGDAVGEPQRVSERVDAVAPDVFAGDDRHGRRCVDPPLGRSRHGCHVDLHQLFERQRLQILGLGAGLTRRPG